MLQLVSVRLREFCTPKQCDDQADTVSLVGRTGGSLSQTSCYNGEKAREKRQSSKVQNSVLLLWPTLQMPEDVVRLRLLIVKAATEFDEPLWLDGTHLHLDLGKHEILTLMTNRLPQMPGTKFVWPKDQTGFMLKQQCSRSRKPPSCTENLR